GWPHGVQQTTLPGGVFRYTPWVPYEDCCRYFCRASAGEATTIPIPTTEAINPTESVVLSILAGMEPSIGSRPTLRHISVPSPTQASQRSSHRRVGGCSSSSLRADAIARRYWVSLDMSRTCLRACGSRIFAGRFDATFAQHAACVGCRASVSKCRSFHDRHPRRQQQPAPSREGASAGRSCVEKARLDQGQGAGVETLW